MFFLVNWFLKVTPFCSVITTTSLEPCIFLLLFSTWFLSYRINQIIKTVWLPYTEKPSSYVYDLYILKKLKKKKRQTIKLPNLLPFLGIGMKEPRLPPITLCGLRNGGFLKDPVYWWRKECILWEVGGLPFFTIGSVIHGIQKSSINSPRSRITWKE